MINWIEATVENIEKHLFGQHFRVFNYIENGVKKTFNQGFNYFSSEKAEDYVFLILSEDYNTITESIPDYNDYYDIPVLTSTLDGDCTGLPYKITHFALKSEYEAILPKEGK